MSSETQGLSLGNVAENWNVVNARFIVGNILEDSSVAMHDSLPETPFKIELLELQDPS